jgi:hypothetical protein
MKLDVVEVICAWCKTYLRNVPKDEEMKSTGHNVSHGICVECSDKMLKEFEQTKPVKA